MARRKISSRPTLRVVRREEDRPDVTIDTPVVKDLSPEAEDALIDAIAAAAVDRYFRSLEGLPE
jgi:hypothetical protein